jgi:opacity protein-like surface antigen
MKKVFLFLVSIFAAANAFAEPFSVSNFYIEGFGGVNFVNSLEEHNVRLDLHPGYAIGGAMGYKFSRFFRLEGEAAYRANKFSRLVDIDGKFPVAGSIQNVTAMGNGIIEIPILQNALIPYFGGGLGEGWSRVNVQIEPIETIEGVYFFDKYIEHKRGFAGQGIVGLIFCAGQKMQAAVEYRYLDGSHIQGNHTIGLNIKSYF